MGTNDDRFYRDLLASIGQSEQTDDLKLLKVIIRYKKLLTEIVDPFILKSRKIENPKLKEDIIELTIKLIDYLNDYFGFLKPIN